MDDCHDENDFEFEQRRDFDREDRKLDELNAKFDNATQRIRSQVWFAYHCALLDGSQMSVLVCACKANVTL